jgi:hypothetical protein
MSPVHPRGGAGRGRALRPIAWLLVCLGAAGPGAAQGDTVPPGFGSLRRDEITVRLSTGDVELQVLPLAEDVIRLLAPDTYQSLRALVDSRRDEIATATPPGVRDPTLVMVTFFGLAPQARFTPDDVNLTSLGRPYRPMGIVPLAPAWNSLQLDARQQAPALYVFDPGVSLRETLTVSYGGRSSDSWGRAVRLLDRERARVVGRAAADGRL